MFQTTKRIAVKASVEKGKHLVVADFGSSLSGNYSTGGIGSGAMTTTAIGGYYNHVDPLLYGMIAEEESYLRRYYRDIYQYDVIAGSAVDLMSTLPFGEFSLDGVDDKQMETFEDTITNLGLRSLFPELSVDYMVNGLFCGTMVYRPQEKKFTDLITHNPDNLKFASSPLYNTDPGITLKVSREMRDFLMSANPYFKKLRERLNPSMVQVMTSSRNVNLDPLTTLFIPRRTHPRSTGSSAYRRLIPIYLLEKILYRGTLTEATRRQRSTTHIQMGSEYYEPQDSDLASVTALFKQADLDPLGAIVATRNDVTVNDIRCLAGSTKVFSTEGIVALKEMVKHDPGELEEDTRVELKDTWIKNHTGQYARVKYWWYRGKKPVCKLVTEKGISVISTRKHKHLVVGEDAKLDLCKVEDLYPGAWVVREQNGVPNTIILELNLNPPDVVGRAENTCVKIPTEMTRRLAYCLAILISEGSIFPNGMITMSNSDKRIIDRYCRYMEEVFGKPIRVKGPYLPPKVRMIRGKPAYFTKPMWHTETSSLHIVDILRQLGLKTSRELRKKNKLHTAWVKSVPWSIMKADSASQFAFLGGYLDGDGSAKGKWGKEIHWNTSSVETAKSIHTLLIANGIVPRRWDYKPLKRQDNAVFYSISVSWAQAAKLKKKLRSTKLHGWEPQVHQERNSGIPAEFVIPYLESRCTSGKNAVGPDGTRGAWFRNDEGKKVFIEGGWRQAFHRFVHSNGLTYPDWRAYFKYETYELGGYNKQLRIIKKVSPTLHKNILRLFKLKFRYEKVREIIDLKKETHVYDLTMDEEYGPPLFVANGIVTKNSAGDFWRWDDTADKLTGMKMKAMGISEAFLSGDVNFSTADNALSVFLEQIRSYRDMATRRVFYEKVFPMVSVLHDFREDPKKQQAKADKKRKRVGDDRTAQAVRRMEDSLLTRNGEQNDLVIPRVHWHKQLRPEADREYLDVLGTLAERGVPVGLRAWAAAGGMDLNAALASLEEDLALRTEIQKVSEEFMGPPDTQDQGYEQGKVDGLRKLVARIEKNIPKKNWLSRDFSKHEEIRARTKTGKPKHVVNARRHDNRVNSVIAQSLRRMAASRES